MFTIDEIVQITHGKLLRKQDSFVYSVSTDSRTIQKGDLFIALSGENFDGHQFIDEVAAKGAGCALVSKDISTTANITLVKVNDTLKALQDLASHYRHTLKTKIVGITGSNGKTTTKFFAHAILSAEFKTFASQKSFNNHIGVPLTLLSLIPETQIGLVEIGMNHPGEILNLTRMADPDVSVVTTVGRAHLMDFGTTERIAHEKTDIYRAARKECIKVFNLDNPEIEKLLPELKKLGSHLTFSSQDKTADIQYELVGMDLNHIAIRGRIHGKEFEEQKISVFGKQNVTNLMAASGIALACGMQPSNIWQALQKCKTVWGRNMLIDLKSGAKLIFDGYNANPDSMKALIDNLASITTAKKKIVIVGDMLEMGDQAEELHEELGRLVAEKNFDVVWSMGEFSKSFEAGAKAAGFSKTLFISKAYEESLAVKVASMVENSDIVVMKGSRGAKLERLVPHFSPLNWEAK